MSQETIEALNELKAALRIAAVITQPGTDYPETVGVHGVGRMRARELFETIQARVRVALRQLVETGYEVPVHWSAACAYLPIKVKARSGGQSRITCGWDPVQLHRLADEVAGALMLAKAQKADETTCTANDDISHKILSTLARRPTKWWPIGDLVSEAQSGDAGTIRVYLKTLVDTGYVERGSESPNMRRVKLTLKGRACQNS